MLDFEAAVSGLSCAAWMYRHTLLHPIQMGEKMVCQAGSDCCDLILVVIGVFAGYPADMIPGAWSDFSLTVSLYRCDQIFRLTIYHS